MAAESLILHGTLDTTIPALTGLHVRTLIYAKEDGKLYKVSALQGDPLTPAQVSNETGAATVCNSDWEADIADHNNAVYLYELPGPDDLCFTLDNIWKMVRVGMTATDSPITAKRVLTTLNSPTTGAIIGFLAIEGLTLVHCDPDFLNCSDLPLTTFTTRVEELGENTFAGFVILRVDDTLRSYDVANNTLSPPLHTFAAGAPFLIPSDNDATDFYFVEGGTLLKLPLDGGAIASPLVTEVGTIVEINLTESSVAYVVRGAATNTLKAIGKTGGGGALELVSTSTTEGIFIFQTAGSFIYYQRLTAISFTSGAVNDTGMQEGEVPNAFWVGATFSSTLSVSDEETMRVIRVDGCSPSCAGGTLTSFDAATNSIPVALGTFPPGIEPSPFSFFGFGNDLLGTGFDAGLNSDIFYINAAQAGSLVRVTNTPAIDETPIFF